MTKFARMIGSALACALICALCAASIAWAAEEPATSSTDANGKFIPGTYEGGTGTLDNAHPGMNLDYSFQSPYATPSRDQYYSIGISYTWYASKDQETWTPVDALNRQYNYRVPDVGEEGYGSVVTHYLKCVATYTFSVAPDYTSTGDLEYITYIMETESAYVKPHNWNPSGLDPTGEYPTWANQDGYHWHPCIAYKGCTHRIDYASCIGNSGYWYASENEHYHRCTMCGGPTDSQPHDYTDEVRRYVEDNPDGDITSETIYLTCGVCSNGRTMSTEEFVEKYVKPSGLLSSKPGNENAGDTDDSEETPEAPDNESATEEDAVDTAGDVAEESATTAPDAKTHQAADTKTSQVVEAKTNQAAFARTADGSPVFLLGASALAAAAIALIARKRLNA